MSEERVYVYTADRNSVNKDIGSNEYLTGLKVLGCTPKYFGWKNSLLWNVATLGKVKAYAVFDAENGTLMHQSFVIRGKEKFNFLQENDIAIAACWTKEDCRGKGIYPAVLSRIVSTELNRDGKAYGFVSEKNLSSIRGIKKAGFAETGKLIRIGAFKRYYLSD